MRLPALLLCLSLAPVYAQQTCEQQGFMKQGPRHVYNNIWGVGNDNDPVRGFRQCTTLEGDAVRFRWENFAPGKGGVKSYPHVTLGWDWDGKHTPTTLLPASIADASKMLADFDIEASGRGRFNVSFDLWLSRKPTITKPREELTHEIMIWLDNRGMTTTRPITARPVIDGREFDLYAGDAAFGKWKYIAFKARKPVLRGTVAIGPFLTYLRETGWLKGDEYINGVSLGPEIVDGSGETRINAFELRN
jgi:hypothetical protein